MFFDTSAIPTRSPEVPEAQQQSGIVDRPDIYFLSS